MSDSLELVLKETIKKIMAEAIAEQVAAAQRGGMLPQGASVPCPAPAAETCLQPVQMPGPCWQKIIFSLKTLCLAGFALGCCGFASAALFPSEGAQAANDIAWMQTVHRDAMADRARQAARLHTARGPYDYTNPVTSLNDPNDPVVAECMAQGEEVPTKLTWNDLWNMDKVMNLVKHDAFLHAAPEDLTAILLFYQLRKLSKGQPIRLDDIPADFKNALPCQWRPVFDVVTAGHPGPTPLPPVPVDFIGPFAPYFE
ncbi:MAG: hypothetical protein EPN97_00115 [Alphaproteobacteria bacterium]|nr:MAG: hypothetical protein EPN97_00115 [Alphaproteobacteria bacterium]